PGFVTIYLSHGKTHPGQENRTRALWHGGADVRRALVAWLELAPHAHGGASSSRGRSRGGVAASARVDAHQLARRSGLGGVRALRGGGRSLGHRVGGGLSEIAVRLLRHDPGGGGAAGFVAGGSLP